MQGSTVVRSVSKTKYQGVVGYVGLGNMGAGIATHLAEVGVRLVVFDLKPDAVAAVAAKGATPASSLGELAGAVDVIIVCVDPERAVTQVVEDLSEFLRPGQTVVIQSSVPPTWVKEMAEVVAPKGVKLYDAPVRGSEKDRQHGTLAILTGATIETVGAERQLLESIGRPLYLGALGGGEVAKLANNAVMTATRLATAESLAFGRAFGVSEENLAEAIKVSSGASWALENWSYFDERLRSGLTLQTSRKQSEEILKTAEGVGIDMFMTRAGRDYSRRIDKSRHTYLAIQEPPAAYGK